MEEDYVGINREAWNKKTELHYDSAFYDNSSFINGRSSLNEIELKLLGDVAGKSVLHLQCHFGQDTISLARMGANATGVDLSDKSIEKARALAGLTHTQVEFICCNVYDLPQHLNKQFDIVFASYGTIGWLPDMERWAQLVKRFVKPGGQFVFVEFHPVVWMFDDAFSQIKYRYFNTGPIKETAEGTYAEKGAPIKQDYVGWNHSLGEVLGSLMLAGFNISCFEEYDYSPYNCFAGMVEVSEGKYQIQSHGNKLPLVYALIGSIDLK